MISSSETPVPAVPPPSAKPGAPALDRGLKLLSFLQRRREGAAVAEMAKALNIPPASAYRLISVLEKRRFVVKNPDDGRYRLGPEILLLAGTALAGLDLRAVAHPHLQDIFDRTKETVELSVLEADRLVVIDKVEGEESVHTLNVGGHRAPFYDSAGLVLLAGLSERRLEAVLPNSNDPNAPRMVFGPRKLPAVLARIREQGYMVDEGKEFNQPQRRSRRIAVPVRDHVGRMQGALSVAVAISRWKPERVPRLTKFLISIALRINELMGFRQQVVAHPASAKQNPK
ncbi:MAG: IclR family transcriptional regulator [Candidatus Sumerlaeota bacterium]|nr:IclR family transcriptional regulator [Candidatus Sumerlaeota bacterium]